MSLPEERPLDTGTNEFTRPQPSTVFVPHDEPPQGYEWVGGTCDDCEAERPHITCVLRGGSLVPEQEWGD